MFRRMRKGAVGVATAAVIVLALGLVTASHATAAAPPAGLMLGIVKTGNTVGDTPSGMVEVQVEQWNGSSYAQALDVPSPYTSCLDFAGSACLWPEGADSQNGVFSLFGSVNGEPELGFVKTANTGSGVVEVHLATYDPSSNSYVRALDTTTDFALGNDGLGSFSLFGSVNGEPELGFVKTIDPGSGTVEVHIDVYNPTTNSYIRVLDTTSAFSPDDADNGFWELLGGNGWPDLFFVKDLDTGSGTTEVAEEDFNGSSYVPVLDTTSDFTDPVDDFSDGDSRVFDNQTGPQAGFNLGFVQFAGPSVTTVSVQLDSASPTNGSYAQYADLSTDISPLPNETDSFFLLPAALLTYPYQIQFQASTGTYRNPGSHCMPGGAESRRAVLA